MNRPSFYQPRRAWLLIPVLVTLVGFLAQTPAMANREGPPPRDTRLSPGDLLVSGSVFQDDPNITTGVTELPPGCVGAACVTAIAGGNYPYVFNNDTVDSSFGVASKISLTELTPTGRLVGSLEVPNSSSFGLPRRSDQYGDEFLIEVRDGAQPVDERSDRDLHGLRRAGRCYRRIELQHPGRRRSDQSGTGRLLPSGGPTRRPRKIPFTDTNAYSGNNGRAAILTQPQRQQLYTVGNAGNGANPQPKGVVLGAGRPDHSADPSARTRAEAGTTNSGRELQRRPVFGDKADKIGKDDNFRGMTLYGNVLYYTKGSGSNGVNTVYFVDTTGQACPTGLGVPAPGAPLPTATLAYDAATGLTPNNMCVLKGFPDRIGEDLHQLVSLRSVVRQPEHALRRSRRRRDQHLFDDHGRVHRGRGIGDRRTAEMGVQLLHGIMATRLHHSVRPEPGHALCRPRLPHR